MRADAFVSLKLVHPLRKFFPPKGRRVPILMYHSISNTVQETHPYFRTVTTPEMFEQHMKHLKENGYSTVSLSETASYFEESGPIRKRPVVVTFDDGFEDFYTEAFPILEKYGFTGIVYLPTAYIGNTTQSFKGVNCMTWAQVRELQSAGIEFGSHTVTHPQLERLERMEEVDYEVRASKDAIEQELGRAVKSFAYPFAFPETNRVFRAQLRRLLQDCGYDNGVSTILGTADRTNDRFFMKRLPANSSDEVRLLTAKLEGAYDWMHTAQYAAKRTGIRRSRSRIAAG